MTTLRSAILAAASAVEAARESLCALDSRTGDGDHGVTMSIGARGVRQKLAALEGDNPAAVIRATAGGMAGVGGAIGPIYATGLLAVAREIETRSGDGSPAAIDPLVLASDCAAAALRAVIGLGHAAPGDKTIVDALSPFAEALRSAASDGRSLADGLEGARLAARRGAEATVDMVAAVGRSSRFGEASRGTADPGATSFALIVEAVVAASRDRVASDEVG